jgi:hypothetical protein
MNIKVSINEITCANRRQKLFTAIHALSEQMKLRPRIDVPWMRKAKTHKYVSRKWENGKWLYEYPRSSNERRANTASQITDVMNGINPLKVDARNVKTVGTAYLKEIAEYLKDHDVKAKWLQNRKVTGVDIRHFTHKWVQGKERHRETKNLISHTQFLPFILPIIQKYGHVSEVRKDPQGRYSYELVGKAEFPDGKKYAISVVLREYEPDNGLELEHRSVFGFTNKLVKSLATADGKRQGRNESPHSLPTASRHNVGKATLPSNHLPVMITNFSVMSIHEYPNLRVFINDITAKNRKSKLAKAIWAVSKYLKVPVSIARKNAGEPYFYQIQQELSDKWIQHYHGLIKQVYKIVAAALGLPLVEIETMKKAIGTTDVLKYRGKIIYSPETGEPIKIQEFDKLIDSIQKFLNRNTKDTAKQILLDSATIGRLLKRMAKFQTSEEMKKLALEKLKYRGKTFEWISESVKNLNLTLGSPMFNSEMARYQVAQTYVASLVTRTNDQVRSDIRDTVLRGIIDKRSKGQVSQDLFNRLGSLNRDWKRIVETEIVNTSNLSGILQDVNDAPEGEKVYFKRYELPGACDKCVKVDGKIVLWSDVPLADDRIKDQFADVAMWEGKAQEKGRTVLVPGTLHPNCRGGWTRWGGKTVDAMIARMERNAAKWDKAVMEARAEYAGKGVENPNDQTAGYVDLINELYREKLGS